MHDDRLCAAIIGTGRIGSSLERDPLRTKPHTHAGWYVSHPHILLTAGADTNPERLRAFGDDWGLPEERLFDRYPEMLAAVRPDLVTVCAYAPEREAMARAALDAVGHSVAECLATPAAPTVGPTQLHLLFKVGADGVASRCSIGPVDQYSFSAGRWWASPSPA